MDPSSKLIRFIYIGTIDAYYKAKRKPLTVDEVETQLCFIKFSLRPSVNNSASTSAGESLNRVDPLWPLTTIKRILVNKALPNNRDVMLALAYCVALVENSELRSAIYQAIPDIVLTSSDLFLFIKYLKDFRPGKGFGYGLRTAVSRWYNKRTAVELGEMLGKNRKHSGFSHADIFKLSHTKFPEGSDNDKIAICKAAFKRGYQVVKKEDAAAANNVEASDDTPGYQILCNIARFKLCENPKEAAEKLTLLNLTIDHIPSHLLKSADVWNALLPKLTYQQLLKYAVFLNDNKLLNPNENFAKKYCKALGQTSAIIDSKVHPLEILVVMRQHETQKRYMEVKKENQHQKKLKCAHKKIVQNPFLLKKLQVALNQSMSHFSKTGLRFFITIDLRKPLITKYIYGMNLFNILEISVLMSLALLKREKEVTIMTFTEELGKLEPVGLTKEMTFEQALDHCKAKAIGRLRTMQNIKAPLKYAIEEKKKCDVFVTFVDSIARSCRHGEPPVNDFKEYKRVMNLKQTKYAIFGMARHKKDLSIYREDENARGLFEFGGFNLNTPKIFEAFLKNQFY